MNRPEIRAALRDSFERATRKLGLELDVNKTEEVVLTLYGGNLPTDSKILARLEVTVTVHESAAEIWCETEKEVEYLMDYEGYCNRATISRPSFAANAPLENNMPLEMVVHATKEKTVTLRFPRQLWRQFKADLGSGDDPVFQICMICQRRYVKSTTGEWVDFTGIDDYVDKKAPSHECPRK